MAEQVIYSDNTVTVSTARVVISGTTYQLRNITSVRMTYSHPTGCASLLILAGAAIGGIGLLGVWLVVSDMAGGNFPGPEELWLGLVFIGTPLVIGIALFVLGRLWARSIPNRYHLVLTTASGENTALTSESRDYVEKVVQHINNALAASSG